ncbi:cytochrome P450 4c3-like [Vespa crabro]|uniref:cytochrome P450 4c3-like n=1 Tax=Vespa crabro TaxID=7445 RepID=UPI001F02B350|nr:cytochrome P450 4c3-like [Vespa crabro]
MQTIILLKHTQHLERIIIYKFLQYCLSTGLINSTVFYLTSRKWKQRRKIMTPTFHFNIIKHFVATFNEEAQYLLIIAERILFHEQTKGKYLQNVQEMDENQIFSEESDQNNKNPIFKKRLALLDLLIAASLNDNQLDEEGIREEVDNFMAAGYSTTATALCFALYLIAKHKDVQVIFSFEVFNKFRSNEPCYTSINDCKLTIQMLQEFSYLERCLKESLRLYPSVHFIARYISHGLQLKKYLIPAGSICNVNIYSLHRNPNIWKNPDIFDANRLLPASKKGRNPYSFIPFSAGARNCIDKKFAMLELKLLVQLKNIAQILFETYIHKN